MKVQLLVFVALLMLVPLVPQAAATSGCAGIDVVEFTDGSGHGVYVFANGASAGGLRIYQESNGFWTPRSAGTFTGSDARADLQKGDACDDPIVLLFYGTDEWVF